MDPWNLSPLAYPFDITSDYGSSVDPDYYNDRRRHIERRRRHIETSRPQVHGAGPRSLKSHTTEKEVEMAEGSSERYTEYFQQIPNKWHYYYHLRDPQQLMKYCEKFLAMQLGFHDYKFQLTELLKAIRKNAIIKAEKFPLIFDHQPDPENDGFFETYGKNTPNFDRDFNAALRKQNHALDRLLRNCIIQCCHYVQEVKDLKKELERQQEMGPLSSNVPVHSDHVDITKEQLLEKYQDDIDQWKGIQAIHNILECQLQKMRNVLEVSPATEEEKIAKSPEKAGLYAAQFTGNFPSEWTSPSTLESMTRVCEDIEKDFQQHLQKVRNVISEIQQLRKNRYHEAIDQWKGIQAIHKALECRLQKVKKTLEVSPAFEEENIAETPERARLYAAEFKGNVPTKWANPINSESLTRVCEDIEKDFQQYLQKVRNVVSNIQQLRRTRQLTKQRTAAAKEIDDKVKEAERKYKQYTNQWKGMKVIQECLEKQLYDCKKHLFVEVTETNHERNLNNKDYIQQIGENSQDLPPRWYYRQTLDENLQVLEEVKKGGLELLKRTKEIVCDLVCLRKDSNRHEFQHYFWKWQGLSKILEILKHNEDYNKRHDTTVSKTEHEQYIDDGNEGKIIECGKSLLAAGTTYPMPFDLQTHNEVDIQRATQQLKDICDDLMTQNRSLVKTLSNLRERTLQIEKDRLIDALRNEKKQQEEIQKQYIAANETLQAQKQELENEVLALKNKRKQQSEELQKCQKAMEQMKQKNQEEGNKMKVLETDKKQLETEKKQWEKEKKTYKQQLEDVAKEKRQWAEKDVKTIEKLSNKESECQRIREMNTGLQQELTKVTSLCNQYKDKCGEYHKNWQLCYQDVQQRDQQIKSLQYTQQECQRYIADLESQVRDGKMKIQSLETEKEKLLTRLSKIAGAKLTQGNAAITDLSDANRPMKIAEKYSELYDNEWTDALEELLDNGAKDNKGIAILLEIITGAYKFCSETAEKYQEGMTQSAVCLPVQPLGTHPSSVPESCDPQRSQQTAGAVQEPVPKTIQLTEEQKQILDDLRKALCPQLLHLVEEHYMSILDELLLKAFGKVKQIIVPCDHSRNRAADLSQEETDETILDVVGKPTKTGDAQIKQTDISDDPKSDVASKKSHGGSSDDVTDKENVQQYLHQEEERMKKLNKRDQPVRDIAHIENTSDLQHEEDLMKKSQEENQAMEGVDNEEKSNQLSHEDEEHRKKLKEKDQAAGDKAQQQLHQELDLVEKKMNEKRQSVSENGQTNDGDVEMVGMEHLVDEKQEENEVHNQKIDQDKGDVHISKNIKKDDGSNRENDQTDVALDMDNHSKVTESAIKQQTVEENKIIEAVVLDGSFDKTKSFARKCANLCWFMRIKDPPLHMMYEVSCGCRMDTESFKHYTQSGKLVKFLVWPALFLHKEGALLAKGVAQPMKKTEEKEFQKKYSTAV